MKEVNGERVKNVGYRLGQALAIITILCVMALVIGFTVATLFRLFY